MSLSDVKATWVATQSGFRFRYPYLDDADVYIQRYKTTGGETYSRLYNDDSAVNAVRELYLDLKAGALDVSNPEQLRCITDTYARMFPHGFRRLLEEQINNPHLTGYFHELLKDTLRFIDTGCRHMAHDALHGLLTADQNAVYEGKSKAVSMKDDPFYVIDMKRHIASITRQCDTLGLNRRSACYDQAGYLWLTRSGGPEDIVCTMYIIFCFK